MNFSININDIIVETVPNISVLQACENAGIAIPRFCYHEKLSVAGNCRMCLVFIAKTPKLQASCAITVSKGMSIKTNTLSIKKAREGILEFLLINHPLDCPICDQGGECDLQDQSLIYGSDKSRFKDFKKALEDKDCGPLIKTVMTRCINCTRCIRFINEIVGAPIFGSVGRGNTIEISSYIKKYIDSELSANILDLCPVGALLPKPNAYTFRSWELKTIQSIDPFDSFHSNLQINVRGYDILRILPRFCLSINEEWISDKARFAFDGFALQRLNIPMIKENNKFKAISWLNALKLSANALSLHTNNINISIGSLVDFNSLISFKKFSLCLNSFIVDNNINNIFNKDFQVFYKFNSLIKNICKSDACLLVGLNPRIDVPLLHYHLRKKYMLGNNGRDNFLLANIGSKIRLSFPCTHLGNSTQHLLSFLEGKNFFSKIFRKSKNPCFIINPEILKNLNLNILDILTKTLILNTKIISNLWHGLNFFYTKSNNFTISDLSYTNNLAFDNSSTSKLLYVLEDFNNIHKLQNYRFIIFQGNQNNKNIKYVNIILPNLSFVEKTSLFVNCEGNYQKTQAALSNINNSNNDFYIFKNLLYNLNILFFNKEYSFFIPHAKSFMNKTFNCFFSRIAFCYSFFKINNSYLISTKIDNFYKSGQYSLNYSINMSKCSKFLLNKNPFI
jgi:NADH-quinone oxidoreductase chain G